MHYWARLSREGRHTLAEFPDCPGCQTFARAGEDIANEAAEALTGWLESHLAHGEAPPEPKARARGRGILVPVPATLAVRLQLRWARQARRLSQAEFGKRLGVTRQQVHLFESRGTNPRLTSLERIATSLGLELELVFRERKLVRRRRRAVPG
ncbi:MAG: type II toxin-antitoxin system HicB family antitoxin [Gemmatimonadetes bacterium]|nr:type II toxin-antitoxin system HicB family antitoxin [Gemmatimonadota bacterium]